jgi:hypothetical protein
MNFKPANGKRSHPLHGLPATLICNREGLASKVGLRVERSDCRSERQRQRAWTGILTPRSKTAGRRQTPRPRFLRGLDDLAQR